jgi:nicotinamide-nucleotide amidase
LRIEMVAVGDELLSGAVLNSNAARLAEGLAGVGLGLRTVTEVGDDVDEIAATLRACCARADVVVVSGGLGPTSDDLTREGLAAVAGVGLVRDPTVEARLREVYAGHGVPIPEIAYRQADVPSGATLLPNPRGSAPGLRMRVGNAVVYALPGVPSELDAMLSQQVVGEIAALAGDHPVPVTVTIRVALAGESAIAASLTALEREAGADVRFAYLAEPGDVRVKVTGTSADAVSSVAADAAAVLGPVAYSSDGRSLDAVVHGLLASRGATVAVAESLTGGLVAAALTDMAGASATFRGGAVVYATELKARFGVPAELLAERGPVDPDVAAALAEGVRERFASTYGVATTGVAGPEPVGGYPVGAVYLAVAGPAGTRVVRRDLRGDRGRVRRLSVVHAIDLLRRELTGLAPYGE